MACHKTKVKSSEVTDKLDEAYSKKLEEMQKYKPVLETMIARITKAEDKAREGQLQKLKSVYDILNNKNRQRLKLGVLNKCEQILKVGFAKLKNKKISLMNKIDSKCDMKEIKGESVNSCINSSANKVRTVNKPESCGRTSEPETSNSSNKNQESPKLSALTNPQTEDKDKNNESALLSQRKFGEKRNDNEVNSSMHRNRSDAGSCLNGSSVTPVHPSCSDSSVSSCWERRIFVQSGHTEHQAEVSNQNNLPVNSSKKGFTPNRCGDNHSAKTFVEKPSESVKGSDEKSYRTLSVSQVDTKQKSLLKSESSIEKNSDLQKCSKNINKSFSYKHSSHKMFPERFNNSTNALGYLQKTICTGIQGRQSQCREYNSANKVSYSSYLYHRRNGTLDSFTRSISSSNFVGSYQSSSNIPSLLSTKFQKPLIQPLQVFERRNVTRSHSTVLPLVALHNQTVYNFPHRNTPLKTNNLFVNRKPSTNGNDLKSNKPCDSDTTGTGANNSDKSHADCSTKQSPSHTNNDESKLLPNKMSERDPRRHALQKRLDMNVQQEALKLVEAKGLSQNSKASSFENAGSEKQRDGIACINSENKGLRQLRLDFNRNIECSSQTVETAQVLACCKEISKKTSSKSTENQKHLVREKVNKFNNDVRLQTGLVSKDSSHQTNRTSPQERSKIHQVSLRNDGKDVSKNACNTRSMENMKDNCLMVRKRPDFSSRSESSFKYRSDISCSTTKTYGNSKESRFENDDRASRKKKTDWDSSRDSSGDCRLNSNVRNSYVSNRKTSIISNYGVNSKQVLKVRENAGDEGVRDRVQTLKVNSKNTRQNTLSDALVNDKETHKKDTRGKSTVNIRPDSSKDRHKYSNGKVNASRIDTNKSQQDRKVCQQRIVNKYSENNEKSHDRLPENSEKNVKNHPNLSSINMESIKVKRKDMGDSGSLKTQVKPQTVNRNKLSPKTKIEKNIEKDKCIVKNGISDKRSKIIVSHFDKDGKYQKSTNTLDSKKYTVSKKRENEQINQSSSGTSYSKAESDKMVDSLISCQNEKERAELNKKKSFKEQNNKSTFKRNNRDCYSCHKEDICTNKLNPNKNFIVEEIQKSETTNRNNTSGDALATSYSNVSSSSKVLISDKQEPTSDVDIAAGKDINNCSDGDSTAVKISTEFKTHKCCFQISKKESTMVQDISIQSNKCVDWVNKKDNGEEVVSSLNLETKVLTSNERDSTEEKSTEKTNFLEQSDRKKCDRRISESDNSNVNKDADDKTSVSGTRKLSVGDAKFKVDTKDSFCVNECNCLLDQSLNLATDKIKETIGQELLEAYFQKTRSSTLWQNVLDKLMGKETEVLELDSRKLSKIKKMIDSLSSGDEDDQDNEKIIIKKSALKKENFKCEQYKTEVSQNIDIKVGTNVNLAIGTKMIAGNDANISENVIKKDKSLVMSQVNEIMKKTVKKHWKKKSSNVSVGNVKRSSEYKRKRKRYKSELERLHDDIKEMFISSDVLNITGMRACRLKQDDLYFGGIPEPSENGIIYGTEQIRLRNKKRKVDCSHHYSGEQRCNKSDEVVKVCDDIKSRETEKCIAVEQKSRKIADCSKENLTCCKKKLPFEAETDGKLNKISAKEETLGKGFEMAETSIAEYKAELNFGFFESDVKCQGHMCDLLNINTVVAKELKDVQEPNEFCELPNKVAVEAVSNSENDCLKLNVPELTLLHNLIENTNLCSEKRELETSQVCKSSLMNKSKFEDNDKNKVFDEQENDQAFVKHDNQMKHCKIVINKLNGDSCKKLANVLEDGVIRSEIHDSKSDSPSFESNMESFISQIKSDDVYNFTEDEDMPVTECNSVEKDDDEDSKNDLIIDIKDSDQISAGEFFTERKFDEGICENRLETTCSAQSFGVTENVSKTVSCIDEESNNTSNSVGKLIGNGSREDNINRSDREYYQDKNCKKLIRCKICKHLSKSILLVRHYKTAHPDSEIMISRLSQETVNEALRLSEEFCSDNKAKKMSGKSTYSCRLCSRVCRQAASFYDHVSSHTGEYRFNCLSCPYEASNKDAIKNHFYKEHCGGALCKATDYKKVFFVKPLVGVKDTVYAYVCLVCNFFQLNRYNVDKHVKECHSHLGCENMIGRINFSCNDNYLHEYDKSKGENLNLGPVNEHSNSDSCFSSAGIENAISSNFTLSCEENIGQDSILSSGDSQNTDKNFNINAFILSEPIEYEETNRSHNIDALEDLTDKLVENFKTVSRNDNNVFKLSSKLSMNSCLLDDKEKNKTRKVSVKGCITSRKNTKWFTASEKVDGKDNCDDKCQNESINVEVPNADDGLQHLKPLSSQSLNPVLPKHSYLNKTEIVKVNENLSTSFTEVVGVKCSDSESANSVSVCVNKPEDFKSTVVNNLPNGCSIDSKAKIGSLISVVDKLSDAILNVPDKPNLTVLRDCDMNGQLCLPYCESGKTVHGSEDTSDFCRQQFWCLFKDISCKTITIGHVMAHKKKCFVVFSCVIDGCNASPTTDCNFFLKHIYKCHSNLQFSTICSACNSSLGHNKNAITYSMFTAFLHLIQEHLTIWSYGTKGVTSTEAAHILGTTVWQLSTEDNAADPIENVRIENVVSLNPSANGVSNNANSSMNLSQTEVSSKSVSSYCTGSSEFRPYSNDTSSINTANKDVPKKILGCNVDVPRSHFAKQRTCKTDDDRSTVSSDNIHLSDNFSKNLKSYEKHFVASVATRQAYSGMHEYMNWRSQLARAVKHTEIFSLMSAPKKLRHLFKCMDRMCSFSCDSPKKFEAHCQNHITESLKKPITAGAVEALGDWRMCVYCGDSFNMPTDLRQHVEQEHSQSAYQCSYCFYRAFCTANVAIHQSISHFDQPSSILHCQTNNQESNAKKHRLKKSDVILPYACSVESCNMKTYIPSVFEKHLEKHSHQSKSQSCVYCGDKNLKDECIIEHYKVHSLNMYQCVHCPHGTDTEEIMRLHLCTQHPDFNPTAIMRVRESLHHQNEVDTAGEINELKECDFSEWSIQNTAHNLVETRKFTDWSEEQIVADSFKMISKVHDERVVAKTKTNSDHDYVNKVQVINDSTKVYRNLKRPGSVLQDKTLSNKRVLYDSVVKSEMQSGSDLNIEMESQ